MMTNGAAIGYMLLAAKRLELDEKTIKELARAMYFEMDFYTEGEAEDAYNKSP